MSEQASNCPFGCPHDLTQEEIAAKLGAAIGDQSDSEWAAEQKGVWRPDISAVRHKRRKPVLALCEAMGIEKVTVYREKK